MASAPATSPNGRVRGERFALAALRERLDAGSRHAAWRTDPDGVLGRVLELPAGAVVTYPLALDAPATLTARVRLYPHDWRDLSGAVRARVAVSDSDGSPRTVWSATLRAADRGPAGGRSVRVALSPTTTALHLSVSAARGAAGNAVRRAAWVDPALHGAAARPAVPDRPSPADRLAAGPARAADDGPLFSVLVPVHEHPVSMLDEAVESVRGQSFGDWELCLVDDGSRDPRVVAALAGYAADDPRIRCAAHPVARGISAATNTALELATGRYIALLDHDDTLAPDALQRIAERIGADPSLDMIYSDEDILDGGRQVWVHLKPAWSPDTLRTNGYTCHLGVYRRTLVQQIGGFRGEFDGSQDIDMILRLTERSDRIAHVPAILYHWRAHSASTAGGDAKPYAYVAARNAYADHLRRTGSAGEVGYGPPGLYRISASVPTGRRIAIVLAVADASGVAEAAATWTAQPHREWEVVVSAPRATAPEVTEALAAAGVAQQRITVLENETPITDGASCAEGLCRAGDRAAACVDDLLILQSPAAGLTHDWLGRLAGYAGQDGIAAAGPVLLAPDGRVLHAGVALPEGVALHLLHGGRTSMDDFFGYGTSVHNVSALSGALVMASAAYSELGGLDPALRELALVELCVRAGRAGGRIATVPDVRLRLTGPDPAVNDLPALRALQERWRDRCDGDPYYNPGYRTDRGDFTRRAG